MERLTKRDETGNVNPVDFDAADFWLQVPHEVDQAVTRALNVLAAYEDSGLSPKEVAELAERDHLERLRYQG